MRVSAYSDTASQLILQQNFYPHWYYENGGIKKEVNSAGINFMSAPVAVGNNNIVFSFEPVIVNRMMLFSLLSFIILLLLAFVLKPTQSSPS